MSGEEEGKVHTGNMFFRVRSWRLHVVLLQGVSGRFGLVIVVLRADEMGDLVRIGSNILGGVVWLCEHFGRQGRVL